MPLVICDDEMLAQGGEELSRRLAENKERVQCILLASPAGSLGADAAGPAALVNVLLKPVREQPLFDALVAVVCGTEAGTGPGSRAKPRQPGGTGGQPRTAAGPKRTPISDLRHSRGGGSSVQPQAVPVDARQLWARAEWAVNGREAVEKFSPGQCDAILMDCNMPELDGFGATAAIRKIEAEQPAARRVRIIALTANALAGERERCLAAGMDDYISKPFTTQQLYHALLGRRCRRAGRRRRRAAPRGRAVQPGQAGTALQRAGPRLGGGHGGRFSDRIPGPAQGNPPAARGRPVAGTGARRAFAEGAGRDVRL